MSLSLTTPLHQGKIALYYPHIHFRSRAWLRGALLYYDQLSRIVPAGLEVDARSFYADFMGDPDPLLSDIRALAADGFLVEDPPEPHVGTMASDFFDFAMEHLRDESKRARLVPILANRKAFYAIHPAKIDADLAKVLIELQLAHRTQGDAYSDLEIEPVTGGLYMLFLASRIAGRRDLVTDSSIYQSLMYTPLPGRTMRLPSKGDREFRLATAVIKTVVPVSLETMPLDTLLRVREDLAGQRTRFQDRIAVIAKGLENATDEGDLQAAIEAHQRELNDEYEELKDRLSSADLALMTGLFSVSVPTWVTAGWGLNVTHFSPLLVGAGVVAVSGIVMKNIFDRRASQRSSTATYVLSLRKRLGALPMAESIVTLNLADIESDDDSGNLTSGGRTAGPARRGGRVFARRRSKRR